MSERPNLLVNIQSLIDEAKCYETIRGIRWPEEVGCTKCNSQLVIKQGFDVTQAARQRYLCKACGCRFDDLTGIFWLCCKKLLRTEVFWEGESTKQPLQRFQQ